MKRSKLQELVFLLGIGSRRIQQLRKKGIIPRGDRGNYDVALCIQRYTRFLKRRGSFYKRANRILRLRRNRRSGEINLQKFSLADFQALISRNKIKNRRKQEV